MATPQISPVESFTIELRDHSKASSRWHKPCDLIHKVRADEDGGDQTPRDHPASSRADGVTENLTHSAPTPEDFETAKSMAPNPGTSNKRQGVTDH